MVKLSYGVFEADFMPGKRPVPNFTSQAKGWQYWAPRVLFRSNIRPWAVMEESQFSTKPIGWTGVIDKSDVEVPLVKGAQLQERRLRHILAWSSFLVNARLDGSDVSHGWLQGADLRNASLRRPTFARQFKKHSGHTFSAFLNRLRLQAACRELGETDHSVLDIALGCGFTQVSFFNRIFRRLMHRSPSEYRTQCRRKGRKS